ncbi:hypothetical protein CCR75_008700 [Bremia lactucae]|uniref:HTH psq-type domain-containing protein n=1 Tax=Bremia lactucae TaxID=4779 RepID=A0A976IER2_BRELC|nr:hypothetical protein CCR75_008700 [Bremia lactucae]
MAPRDNSFSVVHQQPLVQEQYHVYLQPFHRSPHNTFPSHGRVHRLPNMATLLRHHHATQHRESITSARDFSSNFVRHRTPVLKYLFQCPQFATPMKKPRNGVSHCEVEPIGQDLDCSMGDRTSTLGIRNQGQSKASRYLREIDRRHILLRIAQGEKQSALAKEYHVSRAAICNLNKHRAEVLSRKHEHPLAKHPKRRNSTKVKNLIPLNGILCSHFVDSGVDKRMLV